MHNATQPRTQDFRRELQHLETVAADIGSVDDLKEVLRRLTSLQRIVFDELKRRSAHQS